LGGFRRQCPQREIPPCRDHCTIGHERMPPAAKGLRPLESRHESSPLQCNSRALTGCQAIVQQPLVRIQVPGAGNACKLGPGALLLKLRSPSSRHCEYAVQPDFLRARLMPCRDQSLAPGCPGKSLWLRNRQVRSLSLLAGLRSQGVRPDGLAPFSFCSGPCLLAPLADGICRRRQTLAIGMTESVSRKCRDECLSSRSGFALERPAPVRAHSLSFAAKKRRSPPG